MPRPRRSIPRHSPGNMYFSQAMGKQTHQRRRRTRRQTNGKLCIRTRPYGAIQKLQWNAQHVKYGCTASKALDTQMAYAATKNLEIIYNVTDATASSEQQIPTQGRDMWWYREIPQGLPEIRRKEQRERRRSMGKHRINN